MAYRQSVTINPTSGNSGSITCSSLWGIEEARAGSDLATKTANLYGSSNIVVGYSINSSAAPVVISNETVELGVGACSFDLSTIPVTARVKDVKFGLYGMVEQSGTVSQEYEPADLYIVKYDWGSGSVASGDWISLDTLNNPVTYPILGAINTRHWARVGSSDTGNLVNFLGNQALLDYVQANVGTANPVRLFIVERTMLKKIYPDASIRVRLGWDVGDQQFYPSLSSFFRSTSQLVVIYE